MGVKLARAGAYQSGFVGEDNGFTRLRSPSFCSRLATWVFVVCSLMTSASAISQRHDIPHRRRSRQRRGRDRDRLAHSRREDQRVQEMRRDVDAWPLADPQHGGEAAVVT